LALLGFASLLPVRGFGLDAVDLYWPTFLQVLGLALIIIAVVVGVMFLLRKVMPTNEP
jgi:hypothetical protein